LGFLMRFLLGTIAGSLAATATAETLTIPGSGNPEYVLGELAKAFNNQQQQHRVLVPPSTGTAGALRDLASGTATIARVGRPLTDAERGRDLSVKSLGRDAVVFVGGAGVSIRSVTRAQMLDVYAGKLTNWRDLGGKPSPIRLLGRETTDASRQVLAREIKGFAELRMHEDLKLVHLDPQLIELLDRFPGSLGYLNRSALFAAKTKLAILALETIEPTIQNLASGRYPLWLDFGLAYNAAALTDAGRAFLAFVDSPAGLGVLRAHGVLVTAPTR
jgi:phosphate transport system substrate-binding protein